MELTIKIRCKKCAKLRILHFTPVDKAEKIQIKKDLESNGYICSDCD